MLDIVRQDMVKDIGNDEYEIHFIGESFRLRQGGFSFIYESQMSQIKKVKLMARATIANMVAIIIITIIATIISGIAICNNNEVERLNQKIDHLEMMIDSHKGRGM